MKRIPNKMYSKDRAFAENHSNVDKERSYSIFEIGFFSNFEIKFFTINFASFRSSCGGFLKDFNFHCLRFLKAS